MDPRLPVRRPAESDVPLLEVPTTIEDVPPQVVLIGRFDRADPDAPKCAWPGCKVVARFDGPAVSVALEEEERDGGPSEWDVVIDGVVTSKLVPRGRSSYSLASGLAAGEHTVEIRKRNEARSGATRFLGYDFPDGKLLSPPARAARKIEIIGDASASAIGIVPTSANALLAYCNGPSEAARFQSFGLSFGAKLGEVFQADVAGTVFSGKGVVRNALTGDPQSLPLLYGRADPLDANSVYDTNTIVPDVVVCMMGDSDFAVGPLSAARPTPLATFIDVYRDFVETLRAKYPSSHVFLVTSPTASDSGQQEGGPRTNLLAGTRAVRDSFAAAGDANVHTFAPAPATLEERTSCGSSGSAALHARVASELAAEMRMVLGWK